VATVDIRCPHCSYVSFLKNEKTHEYSCVHCGTTFVFVDTTEREVMTDVRRHNCPICGRPVMVEGYVCKICGKEDLCENCVDELSHKIMCRNCIKQRELDCLVCGMVGIYQCPACGDRYCGEDAQFVFNIKGDYSGFKYFRLKCPKCEDIVCRHCFVEKRSLFSGKTYYCRKCGSKLEQTAPMGSDVFS
jgi:DNA-directed RNA polymerase subunit RPC12/RpoP